MLLGALIAAPFQFMCVNVSGPLTDHLMARSMHFYQVGYPRSLDLTIFDNTLVNSSRHRHLI